MRKIFKCRRTSIALISIACLTAIGLLGHIDVSTAIATIAVGLAGANSMEASVRHYSDRSTPDEAQIGDR